MTTTSTPRRAAATPNGQCWCDCGGTTKPGSFFLQGHDKRAERYLAAINGAQNIAERLAAQGYVPGTGGSLHAATLAADPTYELCGRARPNGENCRVIGHGAGIRRHRADDSQHAPTTD
ncbi:hypothetical protein AD006_28965 (plasmid) [Pseudonocardia sp. EC080610-09]|uniref:hypothetical protein n=1 Tax=unclassified Pseudonocardia TaxID=2619320 RepID=UPI000706B27A|nr:MULTISPECIES: hypothetical protein [unclassified Pseudonocardia]ALL79333.1 hypothetical protein AD006_28965 [Pseudonocardia sp. EC080610-09]ALL85304.1 hypothetical protein AD017_29355 [Pseudonocardia sp. EC080619-01]